MRSIVVTAAALALAVVACDKPSTDAKQEDQAKTAPTPTTQSTTATPSTAAPSTATPTTVKQEVTIADGDLDRVLVPAASDDEALRFIDRHSLSGSGLGYIDVHLLASTALSRGARLWTIDKPLVAAAKRLDLAHESR